MLRRTVGVVTGVGLVIAALAFATGASATEVPAPLAQATATRRATATPRATQTAGVQCAVLAASLAVRSGPGTAFAVEGTLPRNTVVRAVAFVPVGAPGGRWIAVERITPGKAVSFVSAEPRFLFCRGALMLLPTARVPATPRPAPTRTPRPTPTRLLPLALVPVAGDLSASPNIRGRDPRNEGALVLIPGASQADADAALEQDGIIRFDDALVFGVDVFDANVGTQTGAGIKEVQFDVYYFDDNGDKVQTHFQRELRAPYCVFGDTRGVCNVWRFSQSGNRWPSGEPLTPGTVFRADITIVPETGDPALWLWQFRMD